MADEQAPAGQDQPQPSAPEEGPGATPFSEGFDPTSLPEEIQGRYQQMQADYTRKTQELANQRGEYEQAQQWMAALSDPDTQAQALAALGYEVQPEDVPDYQPEFDPNAQEQYQGPQEFYDPRVDELEQRLAAQDYERQLDGLEERIDGGINQIVEQKGLNLSPEIKDLIFDRVLASEPNVDGSPAVDQAVDFVLAQLEAHRSSYVKGKQGVPRAPAGVPGSPTPDLNDRDTRREHMAAIMQAADPDA